MTIDHQADVTIVGAGVAGVAAAYALERMQKKVNLVYSAPGMSSLVGAAWCQAPAQLATLLGTTPLQARLIESEFVAALSCYDVPLYDEPYCLATTEGGLIECAAKQTTALDLAPLKGKSIALCGLSALHSLHAPRLAKQLSWQLSKRFGVLTNVTALTLDWQTSQSGVSTALLFAKELDDQARQTELLDKLRALKAANNFDALLLPPILAFKDNAFVMRVREALKVPVGELSECGPSTQALRLEAALHHRLALATNQVQARALSIDTSSAILSLKLDNEISLSSTHIILATGKLAASGVMQHQHMLTEPITKLNAHSSSAKITLSDIGLSVNERGAVSDQAGTIFHPQVFAAGTLLKALDITSTAGSLGASALSGFLAGQRTTERSSLIPSAT